MECAHRFKKEYERGCFEVFGWGILTIEVCEICYKEKLHSFTKENTISEATIYFGSEPNLDYWRKNVTFINFV